MSIAVGFRRALLGRAAPLWVLRGGGQAAALDIDFVNARAYNRGPASIPSLLSCTRASTGYYTNADGSLVSFLSNVLRYGTNGLLVEEARTNLCLQSQTFQTAWSVVGATITADQTAAPDGTTTADLLTETSDGSPATHRIFNTTTLATSTTYSMSLYVKPNGRTWIAFDLNGAGISFKDAYFNCSGAGALGSVDAAYSNAFCTAIGNGWYRIGLTFTTGTGAAQTWNIYLASANNTISYQGGGASGAYLWGAQLEAGAFATSYIPTTSSSATRAADFVASANVAWLTQGKGTVVGYGTYFGSGGTHGLFSLNDGSASNRIDFRNGGTGLITNATVAQASMVTTGYTQNVAAKVALGYDTNDMTDIFNGANQQTDVSGTPPANITSLQVGGLDGGAGANNFDGYITRLAYFNSRLSNAALQALTT